LGLFFACIKRVVVWHGLPVFGIDSGRMSVPEKMND